MSLTMSKTLNVTLTDVNRAAIEASICKRDFYEFALAAWKIVDTNEFVPNWHIKALCDHLQAVAEGKIKRLLINIPPGTAKSMVVSVLFPAWMWTRRPKWRAISTSHSLEQAIRDTRKSRDLLRSDWYQERWPIEFKDDADRKSGYENSHLGFRIAKPFTSLTGERGNCVIIDDPHSVDTAKSDAERTATVQTFLESVPSRLNNPMDDAIIVIMQRLHETDVAGTILEMGLGYEHLCIPMEYEGDKRKTSIGWTDPRKRKGQLLHPERIPLAKVNEYKLSLGKVGYAGQYQQRPAPKDAGVLDTTWFKRFELRGGPDAYPGMNFYMTSDHATSGTGDYNVFRMWGVDANRNVHLVDSFRRKCTMETALGITSNDGIIALASAGALPMVKRWKPLAFFPEDDPAWKATSGFFVQAMRATGHFVTIKPQPTSGMGDKVNKAQSYVAIASLGQVHLPKGKVGDEALEEYAKFPTGKHDDQVDADGMIARVIDQVRGYVPLAEAEAAKQRDYAPSRSASGNDSDSFFI